MLNEMMDMISCPVCGRTHLYRPLPAHWCPFCGGGDTRILKNQINVLNNKVEIIQQLLEWKNVIDEIDGE